MELDLIIKKMITSLTNKCYTFDSSYLFWDNRDKKNKLPKELSIRAMTNSKNKSQTMQIEVDGEEKTVLRGLYFLIQERNKVTGLPRLYIKDKYNITFENKQKLKQFIQSKTTKEIFDDFLALLILLNIDIFKEDM